MSDHRAITSLLQRTRPDAIGEPYNRVAEGKPPTGRTVAREFMARVSAAVALNGSGTGHATDPTTQWTYSIVEVEKTGAGVGGWTDVDEGRSGDAYNDYEAANTTTQTDVLGIGCTLEDLGYPAGTDFLMWPLPVGLSGFPIRCRVVRFVNATTGEAITEYRFCEPNGLGGGCAA
jgi:hypothetical protein